MKFLLVGAILLLSLFLMPMTVMWQQSVRTPNTTLFKHGLDLSLALYGPPMHSNEPGSGGGGQGVI